MLKNCLWRKTEPRLDFPVFGNAEPLGLFIAAEGADSGLAPDRQGGLGQNSLHGDAEVSLLKLFKRFDAWLEKPGKLVMQVASAKLAPPLKLERNLSQYFRFHRL